MTAVTTKRTWTPFKGVCRFCGDTFRISQETIDQARIDEGFETETDAEVAEGFDICLECVEGKPIDGEKEPK